MTGLPAQLLFLAPAAAALALFLFIHVLLWQVIPQSRKGTLVLSLSAAVAYLAVAFVARAAWALPLIMLIWASGPVFAFLIMLYFHFYFGVDRSVSMRILGELAGAPGGEMTLEALDAVYPKRAMIVRRMAVLLEKEYVTEQDGRYALASKGRKMVRLALLGKGVYNLDASG